VAVQAVAAQAEAAAVQLEAVAGAVVEGAAGPLQPEVAVAGLWAAAAVVGLRLAVRAEAGAAVVGLQLAARPDAGRLAWADDTLEG
jgi:hypothetical protein